MGGETVSNAQKVKIPKTETEYNVKSLRFLLLTVTFMFLVISSLMIVLGMSVYAYFHTFSYFYEGGRSIFTPSVLTVLLAMVFWIVFSFGFFGALKQSTCMVNIYALLLSLVLLVKLVIVIMSFTLNASTVMQYIHIPVEGYATDPEIQQEIDSIQTLLNCCGSESYLDYAGMEFGANQSVVVINKETTDTNVVMMVPESCCVTTTSEETYCTLMRTNSCKNALVNFIAQNSSVLGVLGISVMFMQALGITFALLLARGIRKLKSERALHSWKIKEQIIVARNKSITEENGSTVYIDPTNSSKA